MKDLPLKLRIRKVLWAQGYHCPLEVDLSSFDYDSKSNILKRSSFTDIDVLGLRFDSDLRMSVLVADCKSGKESEGNRLFWLRGIMDFFGAHDGIFVKSVIRPQARSLAPKLGVRVLDEQGLELLERAVGADRIVLGVGDKALQLNATSNWGLALDEGETPSEKQLALKDVYVYLQYLYWMVDEYRNIQTIIDKFSTVAADLDPVNERHKYLAYVGLQRLCLSILRMASEISARGLTDIQKLVRIYLFGGPLLLRERQQFISLLNSISKEQGFGEGEISLEPIYIDELTEILNRIVLNSRNSSKIMRQVDAVILEHVLGQRRELSIVMGEDFNLDALVILKRIASLFQRSSGLDEKMFIEMSTL